MMKYNNGDIYYGALFNSMVTYDNDDIYRGTLFTSDIKGHGTMTLANGDVCDGTLFISGTEDHGPVSYTKDRGMMIYSDGNIFCSKSIENSKVKRTLKQMRRK